MAGGQLQIARQDTRLFCVEIRQPAGQFGPGLIIYVKNVSAREVAIYLGHNGPADCALSVNSLRGFLTDYNASGHLQPISKPRLPQRNRIGMRQADRAFAMSVVQPAF